MAEVKGDLVTPVKKLTIPTRISKLVSVKERCNKPAIHEPKEAPILNEGANTPPAAPEVKDMISPPIRTNGRYQCTYLSVVNKAPVITLLPEPMASG